MITKTYTSRGVIAFALRIGKSSKAIRFTHTPIGGGSVYTTSSKAEQDALEAHPGFGRDYILASSYGQEVAAPAEDMPVENRTSVPVSDIEQARDYLIETYGYKASDLRSRKSIIEAADSHYITFEGI